MKRNQNFDHNHSQKVLSCRYNMDTNRVEAQFEDGTTLSIDCTAIEDEYGNTPAQRAELDWLLYNKPLEFIATAGRHRLPNHHEQLLCRRPGGNRRLLHQRAVPPDAGGTGRR